MYIEMKKTGLDVSDLITLVQRKGGGNTGFPYKSFVCRCSNCLYSTKGKCALKECCCMDERIRAHTCTFGEMMRYCFSGIGDNVFHFRLRIAIEREAELKSCFLDAGHRKRFYEGLAYAMVLSNTKNAKYHCRTSHLETDFDCTSEGILQADIHEMVVTLIRTYAAYAVSLEHLLLLQKERIQAEKKQR